MTSSDPRDARDALRDPFREALRDPYRGAKNIPSPNDAARAYARFIPREELGDFAAWKPGSLGAGQAMARPPAAPAEPNADEWRARVAAGLEHADGIAAVALQAVRRSGHAGVALVGRSAGAIPRISRTACVHDRFRSAGRATS